MKHPRFTVAVLSLVTVLLLVIGGVGSVATALAADADEVAEGIADNGYYIEPGADVPEGRVSELVGAVRAEGEAVSFVVLAEEPPGGATTFAGAVFERRDRGVVVVVAPQTVGWEGETEVFGVSDIDRALDLALDGSTDIAVLEAFVAVLLGEGAPESGTAAREDSGAGLGLVVLLVIGALVVVFVVWRKLRSPAGPRIDPRLADVRQRVQGQIDAVANDIIDMEDEVRTAGNPEAARHYEAAGVEYNHAHDHFETAATAEQYLDLANRLDRAIWHLDSAEAILDGKVAPPEPVPGTLPTAPTSDQQVGEASPTTPTPANLPPRPDYAGPGDTAFPPRPPQPQYARRSGRRSTYGGGGITDLLAGVAAAMAAKRVVSSPRRRSQAPRSTAIPRPRGTGRTSGSSPKAPKGDVGRGRGGGRRTRGG